MAEEPPQADPDPGRESSWGTWRTIIALGTLATAIILGTIYGLTRSSGSDASSRSPKPGPTFPGSARAGLLTGVHFDVLDASQRHRLPSELCGVLLEIDGYRVVGEHRTTSTEEVLTRTTVDIISAAHQNRIVACVPVQDVISGVIARR
jgi:hypothetical protein